MNIIDLHCDTILHIYGAEYKNNERIGLRENNLHIDLDKLSKANSMGQFFALYVNLEQKFTGGDTPLNYCLGMLDKFYTEIDKNCDKIAIARNYEEMDKNSKKGKISAFLTIEEGGVLEGELYNLRNFYRLGVRLITLTWNYPNEIGYPHNKKEYSRMGLTHFGVEVIREMNKLGMVIDVSHLSDKGFYDVSVLSTKPFVASHSNARTIKGHSRNLNDDMIKILGEKGGVTGINFCADFLGEGDISRVEDIVRHIKHIKDIGGIDVIALGTDFDGISCDLEVRNIGEMDKLISALERQGFKADEIEKICFKNAQRVIKDVMR